VQYWLKRKGSSWRRQNVRSLKSLRGNGRTIFAPIQPEIHRADLVAAGYREEIRPESIPEGSRLSFRTRYATEDPVAGTVTLGVEPIPAPPPPPPDYAGFQVAMLQDAALVRVNGIPELNLAVQALISAIDGMDRGAATAPQRAAGAMAAIFASGQITSEERDAWVTIAETYHMPGSLVELIRPPEPEPEPGPDPETDPDPDPEPTP